MMNILLFSLPAVGRGQVVVAGRQLMVVVLRCTVDRHPCMARGLRCTGHRLRCMTAVVRHTTAHKRPSTRVA